MKLVLKGHATSLIENRNTQKERDRERADLVEDIKRRMKDIMSLNVMQHCP